MADLAGVVPDGLTTGSCKQPGGCDDPYPGKTVLNGGDVLAATNGELPALDGQTVDGSTKRCGRRAPERELSSELHYSGSIGEVFFQKPSA